MYTDDENNVDGLLQPNPERADTMKSDITYYYMFDTMGYYILETMECENGQICDESDYISGEEHSMNYDT